MPTEGMREGKIESEHCLIENSAGSGWGWCLVAVHHVKVASLAADNHSSLSKSLKVCA